jgi:Na+-transporting methylmalonyl-CoA/oxaloacetate decarboxylase beta subunit
MKKRKFTKIIVIFTITCALIDIIITFFNSLLPLYLLYKFNRNIRNAGAIGIIGGADGPAGIFLSGKTSVPIVTIILTALTILGVICLIIVKKSEKKRDKF